jgi:hypothetical protein
MTWLQKLDDELQRLPDKYRAPIILCELEGRTHKEAAQLLRLPQGTVSVRLMRAEKLLAKRLTGRDLATATGSLAACSKSGRQSLPAFDMAVPPPLTSKISCRAGCNGYQQGATHSLLM